MKSCFLTHNRGDNEGVSLSLNWIQTTRHPPDNAAVFSLNCFFSTLMPSGNQYRITYYFPLTEALLVRTCVLLRRTMPSREYWANVKCRKRWSEGGHGNLCLKVSRVFSAQPAGDPFWLHSSPALSLQRACTAYYNLFVMCGRRRLIWELKELVEIDN